MASGPHEWPAVVMLYDRTKRQSALPAIVKGQNFYTEHANNLGEFFRS